MNDTPLAVPIDHPYSSSGNGVVSTRIALDVGYNGFAFRGKPSNPELNGFSSKLVREAWPRPMIGQPSDDGVEPPADFACAPDNWVLRKPVRHFADGEVFKARYPPRNLRNALAKQGPRTVTPWIPTATYKEPPFSTNANTSVYAALRLLDEHSQDLSASTCTLNVLGFVYFDIGDHQGVKDPFLQRQVTRPPSHAVERYRRLGQLIKMRQEGHPTGPQSVRTFFKADACVQQRVATEMRTSLGRHSRAETVDKIARRIFEEAETTPQALTVFKGLAESDLERYADELKVFTQTTQAAFDEAHREEVNRSSLCCTR